MTRSIVVRTAPSHEKKLPHQLESQHKEEDNVIELSGATKEKWNVILNKLRNLGQHTHNNKVIRKGEGEIQVVYRTKGTKEDPDFVLCQYCCGGMTEMSYGNIMPGAI